MTELKITQADRVSAANYGLDNSLIFSADYEALTSGRRDDNRLIQAFARHRIAAEEGIIAAIERMYDNSNGDSIDGLLINNDFRAALARVRGEG